MKRLAIVLLLMISPWSQAKDSCSSDVSRIGFKDKAGKDLEVWRCGDSWHLSNLANEQAYINADGKPCVKNSSTGEQLCCPEGAPSSDKTDTKAKTESSKDSLWTCVAEGPDQTDAKSKTILRIAPKPGGSSSPTVYRITGTNDSKDKETAQKDKTVGMDIVVEIPEHTGRQSGTIHVEQPLGGSSADNKCAERDQGSFCQLPADISGHSYKFDKETKGALVDNPDGGSGDKVVTTDTTGKNAYSAR